MSEAKLAITGKLSAMMFLEFFIWGAWFVSTGVYLGEGGKGYGDGVTTTYSVGPIAAMISPLFLGLFADRFLPSQIVLGICHLVGAVLLWLVPWSIANEMSGGGSTYFWILLAYMMLYMPTLGLTNTVAMRNVKDAQAQFPVIRVFGTVGWIVAGFLIGNLLGAEKTELPFKIAAGASLVLGVFSFFLPHTPPPLKGRKVSAADALGLGALGMMRDWKFLVFAISSMLICIPLQAYYAYAASYAEEVGFSNGTGTVVWGQVAEIVFMLIIPFLFRRLGVKWMLSIGMACWVLRYALFAMGAPESVKWMVFIGILLHGICYDFFFVTGQIYTDQKAPPAMRGQAQGLLVVLTQGVGMYLGALFNSYYHKHIVGERAEGVTLLQAWADFWWVPAALAGGILVGFILLFRDAPDREGGKAV